MIGPNGSGKTSLLRLMHGLQAPSAGRVAWAVPDAEARTRQGYVFQQPIVLRRSVEANLAYPLRLRGVGRAEARERARAVAARFGLAAQLAQSAPSLSGGEMQRLALARAMVTGPASSSPTSPAPRSTAPPRARSRRGSRASRRWARGWCSRRTTWGRRDGLRPT